ncbi:MAG: hypothetical protein Q4Q58_03370 [Thermoplasmata archaeon]|nr:hypothetical protein [Thermoplasmata archaeon]
METTKRGAAAAVAVIAIVAAACCIVGIGGDEGELTPGEANKSALSDLLGSMRSSETEYPARLMVLGNADCNDVIDEEDVKAVRALIADGYVYTESYMADANYDGLIDEQDVEIIERMISFDQDVVYYFNVDYNIASFNMSYPLNLANILTQTLEAICILCPENVVATDERCSMNSPQGTFYTEYEYILDYDSGLGNIGSHKTPNAETYAQVARDNDGYLTVWMNSVNAYNTGYLETQLGSYDKIQLVRLPSWENGAAINGIITAGYLFNTGSGGLSWDRAVAYAEWYDSIMDGIEQRVSTLEESEKKKVIVTYVSSSDSLYSLLAGTSGEHRNLVKLGIVDVAGQYFEDHGITETHYQDLDQEALAAFYQQYGIDLIIGTVGSPYNATAAQMIASYDLRSSQIAQLTGTELVITGWINATGPGEVIFCLMIAKYLYPELFSDMDLEEVVNTYLQFMGNYGTEEAGQWTYDTLNLLYCGEGSDKNIMAD